jgi:hypothetical protein
LTTTADLRIFIRCLVIDSPVRALPDEGPDGTRDCENPRAQGGPQPSRSASHRPSANQSSVPEQPLLSLDAHQSSIPADRLAEMPRTPVAVHSRLSIFILGMMSGILGAGLTGNLAEAIGPAWAPPKHPALFVPATVGVSRLSSPKSPRLVPGRSDRFDPGRRNCRFVAFSPASPAARTGMVNCVLPILI